MHLPPEERQTFLPLSPEFAIEIRSPTDSLADWHLKMREYLDNGTRMGLLIVPEKKQVYIYLPGCEVQLMTDADVIDCSAVLPGFELVVTELWK